MSKGGMKAQLHRVHGEMVTIQQAADALGIEYDTLRGFMHRHQRKPGERAWTLEECVEWYEAVRQGRQKRNPGKRAELHCVHGYWMTIQQAADRLGVSRESIDTWRRNNRRPDGKRPTLGDAYEHYAAVRSGRKPRYHLKQYYRYDIRGETLTVRDVAERFHVTESHVRNLMSQNGRDMVRVYDMLDRCATDKAVRKIMRALEI